MCFTYKQCSACGDAFYCDQNCQKANWKIRHKSDCADFAATALDHRGFVTSLLDDHINPKRLVDPPYYFGNTLAADFLNLGQNEWEKFNGGHINDADSAELDRMYRILLAGCGDIRSLLCTISSLPGDFRGKLDITLCDFDPFVMARNTLFLYMMVAMSDDTPEFEKSLASIWYSASLSSKDHTLVKKALDVLNQCQDAASLEQVTRGLIIITDQDTKLLQQVWNGWYELECEVGKLGALNLRSQHRTASKKYQKRTLPSRQQASWKKWVQNCDFYPEGVRSSHLLYDNPTLTGRSGVNAFDEMSEELCALTRDDRQPKDYLPFVYCLQANMHPMIVWDYRKVIKSGCYDDNIVTMYHTYVSRVIDTAVRFIQDTRLSVKMSLAECFDFKLTGDGDAARFDRIFNSNLMDYVGCFPLVRKFGPMLSKSNPHATLVMELLAWRQVESAWNRGGEGLMMRDMGTRQMMVQDREEFRDRYFVPYESADYDYDPDTVHRFLKTMYLATEKREETKPKPPSSKMMMSCQGLVMRDFRVGLNKIVPFIYRVSGRDGGVPNYSCRTIEWHYK